MKQDKIDAVIIAVMKHVRKYSTPLEEKAFWDGVEYANLVRSDTRYFPKKPTELNQSLMFDFGYRFASFPK